MSDDNGIKVGQIEVRAHFYDVHLRVSGAYHSGKPSARFVIPELKTSGAYPSEVGAETWEALYEKAMVATKSKGVKIEFPISRSTWERTGYGAPKHRIIESGVVTGRHAANGNLLIRWADAKQSEQQTSRHEDIYRPLPAPRQAELLGLLREKDAIDDKIEAFDKMHKFEDRNLDHEVDAEIERVASERVEA